MCHLTPRRYVLCSKHKKTNNNRSPRVQNQKKNKKLPKKSDIICKQTKESYIKKYVKANVANNIARSRVLDGVS